MPDAPATLPNAQFWRGRRVLITGHTGFKGGWLALWLKLMGAEVTGYALPPEHGDGIFAAAAVGAGMTPVTGDIRDHSRLRECLLLMRPEIVFHLAAQALVRRAHRDPLTTYATNVTGTAKVLEAIRSVSFVRSVVIVTSDKVYENHGEDRPFREDDRLGGVEPYGVSKASAEMVTGAFRQSLGNNLPAVATARAGNVIGGGDWGEDRLIPDAIRAFRHGVALEVRNPASTRPWQHVLDPLSGYLLLAERLTQGEAKWRSAWNFGGEESVSVKDLADRLTEHWNGASGSPTAAWIAIPETGAPYEARALRLDSSKALAELGWRRRLPLAQAVEWTADWYIHQARGTPMDGPSMAMIDAYMRS
ncbi:MAG: CDP-glucose 4,6-dehydratase [Rhodospirillaceae bacterium]|nr:MAG: CDP-glucose 4,6-dehydratase [Rhodospirillaceae bacterium]